MKTNPVVAINGNSTLLVLTNNGSGVLTAASTPAVGVSPSDIQAADLNGDSRPDLVTADWGGTVTVLLNARSGILNFYGKFFALTSAVDSVARFCAKLFSGLAQDLWWQRRRHLGRLSGFGEPL